MSQTKAGSFFEAIGDVGVGFLISLAIWEFIIIPMFSIQTSFVENLGITGIFTIVGIIRKYIIRRLVNEYQDSGLSLIDFTKNKLTIFNYI